MLQCLKKKKKSFGKELSLRSDPTNKERARPDDTQEQIKTAENFLNAGKKDKQGVQVLPSACGNVIQSAA